MQINNEKIKFWAKKTEKKYVFNIDLLNENFKLTSDNNCVFTGQKKKRKKIL